MPSGALLRYISRAQGERTGNEIRTRTGDNKARSSENKLCHYCSNKWNGEKSRKVSKSMNMSWHESENANTSYVSSHASLVFVIVAPKVVPPMLVKAYITATT